MNIRFQFVFLVENQLWILRTSQRKPASMSPTRTTWLPGARCSSMQSSACNADLNEQENQISGLKFLKEQTLLNLEHILPELEHSCHVSSSHSTNVIACKRFSSSFPLDFLLHKLLFSRPKFISPFLPMRLQKTSAGRSSSLLERAERYSRVSKESAPFLCDQ